MFVADKVETRTIIDSEAMQVLASDNGYAFRPESLNFDR